MSVNIRAKRLWTFIVHGGERIEIHPKGNFPERHDGRRSVLKFVLTKEAADETKVLLEQRGCHVEVRTETQTEEQKLERQKLAGAFKDTTVFPCERCPQCAFFDPVHADGYCGAEVWPTESVYSLLEHINKARTDLHACPLERGKNYL